jgi:hypothetical protein
LGDLLEQVEVDFGINARRFNGPMTQHPGDAFEPNIGVEHLAGGRMPKDMGPAPRTLNVGAPQGRPCNVLDRVSGLAASERSEGSHRTQEDVVAFDSWAPAAQVL